MDWQHRNPLTGTRGESYSYGAYSLLVEADPVGIDVGTDDPFVSLDTGYIEPETPALLAYDGFDLPTGNCTLDGIAIGCGFAQRLLGSEAVVQAPAETTRYNYERGRFEFFTAYANGFAGFLGRGDTVRSTGNGAFFVNASVDRTVPGGRFVGYDEQGRAQYSGGETVSVDVSHFVNVPTVGLGIGFGLQLRQAPQSTRDIPLNTELFNKIADCAYELFGVNTRGGNIIRDGQLNYDGYSEYLDNNEWFHDGTFTVTTDQSKYDLNSIGGLRPRSGVDAGITFQTSPYTNYIASDVSRGMAGMYSFNFWLGTWVHELGNALAVITNTEAQTIDNITERQRGIWQHRDPGVAMEDCVFGGKVRRNGSIQTK